MNGDNALLKIVKLLFGELPAQWIRLILVGAALAAFYFLARDFTRDMRAESASVRAALNTYVASNELWQKASEAERDRMLRRGNARMRRLYEHNRWVYEDVEP